jgi:hypothetical protein
MRYVVIEGHDPVRVRVTYKVRDGSVTARGLGACLQSAIDDADKELLAGAVTHGRAGVAAAWAVEEERDEQYA